VLAGLVEGVTSGDVEEAAHSIEHAVNREATEAQSALKNAEDSLACEAAGAGALIEPNSSANTSVGAARASATGERTAQFNGETFVSRGSIRRCAVISIELRDRPLHSIVAQWRRAAQGRARDSYFEQAESKTRGT
jgi:hypothetical protein